MEEEKEKKLSDKQKRFCEEYIYDWNATRAAKAAGYSEKTARQIASELLKKSYISKYIESIKGGFLSIRKRKAKKKSDNDFGYVYLVHCECTNYYKIGKTKNNPYFRLKAMQTSIPFNLELVFSIKANHHTDIERCIHAFYKSSRVKGEWFLFSKKELKQVVKYIGSYE